ncbi:MAG: DUF6273 domain-containing protein [Bacilli bacterium]
MEIKKLSAKLAVSLIFATTFLVISIVNGCSFGKAVPARGEGPTYTITMDAKNAPTASETYINVETDIRYSHFEYFDAKVSSGNHVELNASGYITNAIDSQITSILSVTAVFSTEGTLSLGISYYGATFTTVTLTSGLANDLSTELPYYLKLIAVDDLVTITSVTIVYSCAPYERPLNAGDNYYLGSYPQTKVTDIALITVLNTESGGDTGVPTDENDYAWTSYEYYIGVGDPAVPSNEVDFMWYQDVVSGADKYRGVYFTSYRPYQTDCLSSSETSYQDDNGYLISTRYWFKFEPILWDVLSVNETGGPLVLADKILDNCDYYHSLSTRTIDEANVYANNYKESNIRSWLNNDFYNQAFSAAEQESINTTIVDNSVASTGFDPNTYVCANTSDKLFLPSYVDVTNTNYGFSSTISPSTTRVRQATDYAKALGLNAVSGNSFWWLRSPDTLRSDYARRVRNDGNPSLCSLVNKTYLGVLPAFRINR